jgi:hypothetical protein
MNLAKKLNFSVLINEFVGVNRTCTSRDVNTNNLRQRAYCLALNLNSGSTDEEIRPRCRAPLLQ